MKRLRRVKILATLGPASDSVEMITRLAKAGADLFRINMSHASHEVLRQTIANIRAVEEKLEHPLGILVDLQGPKIRIGTFASGSIELKPGDTISLDTSSAAGDQTRVYLPHPELFDAVKPGDRSMMAASNLKRPA